MYKSKDIQSTDIMAFTGHQMKEYKFYYKVIEYKYKRNKPLIVEEKIFNNDLFFILQGFANAHFYKKHFEYLKSESENLVALLLVISDNKGIETVFPLNGFDFENKETQTGQRIEKLIRIKSLDDYCKSVNPDSKNKGTTS